MTEPKRSNPVELLSRIQNEDRQKQRGKLKIFLGYAAGVGKTFAMLEAAHQRKAQGNDVVIAYVETHGRVETEALAKDLQILPRRKSEYHGMSLEEMDVDAVLARHPEIALVDEFAHTNVTGSRHAKRYLDVQELLDSNINVYTTLNIQHLESLNNIVQQITGIKVRETVPDSILKEADEIELVDLPPDELLQRLKEGKVYIPEQAVRAITQFFRKGNLTALREISLREAAERVDEDMLDYMNERSITGPWPASERLLVAISSHPLSERLVRTASRLAERLHAEWFAVYVETPDRLPVSALHMERVNRSLKLAEELGGKPVSISGQSVPDAVIRFAQRQNINRIILGKPLRPRWLEAIRGSIVDEIVRRSGAIDVYVISDPSGPLPRQRPTFRLLSGPLVNYLYSSLMVIGMTVLGLLIQRVVDPVNLVMFYLAIVVIAALYLGRGPALLASFLGVVAFDFFFVNPLLSFSVSDTQYLLTFLGLLIVGLVVSSLTARLHDQVNVAQRRAEEMSTLYSLSRDLATAVGLEAILQITIDHIHSNLCREAVILLPDKDSLVVRAASPDFALDENERAVAIWTYRNGQPAGRGTETLPSSRVRYQPLKTLHGIVGVLGASLTEPGKSLNQEQRQMLEAYSSLAALAIERAQLDEQANQAQVLRASERLQTALLNSISHDLRTPLVTITGVLGSLREAEQGDVTLERAARVDMIETAQEEAARLNRLVSNLLDITRLESGAMKINLEESDGQDAIGAALRYLKNTFRGNPIRVDLQSDLPMVPMDFVLIEQVLINLLENAVKFSPPKAPIEISVQIENGCYQVSIADRGSGIPETDLERIFDKFYRVQRKDSPPGTGLGLSICKGIIEAHSGRIWAENREGGGAAFTFTLPFGESQEREPLVRSVSHG